MAVGRETSSVHEAAMNNHHQILEWLFDHNVNPELFTRRSMCYKYSLIRVFNLQISKLFASSTHNLSSLALYNI